MEQSQYPSYPLQFQQFGDEPYSPWGIQQQQGQQFQHQYAPVHQHFQPPEFQQQQFQTWSNQQSTEEAELEELRLMVKSNALSLQTIGDQIGQIANALSTWNQIASDTEGLAVEEEDKNLPISLDWPFLATGETLIEVQKGGSEGKDEEEAEHEADKEAEPEANQSENSECPENSVLNNQPQPLPLQSENSEESAQDHENSKAQVAMLFPSKDEEGLSVEDDELEEHVQLLNAAPLQSDFDQLEVEEEKSITPADKSTPEKTTEIIQIDFPPPYPQRLQKQTLAMNLPAEDEECFSLKLVDAGQSKKYDTEKEKAKHGQLRITVPWLMGLRIPHKLLGVEDLWNSQVRLKPSFEGAPELELKTLLVHLGYVSCNSSLLLAFVIAANFSGRRENVVKRSCEERRRVKLVIEDVAPEKILKWPL
jgi:hypothetical protein